jgi:GMP reductase
MFIFIMEHFDYEHINLIPRLCIVNSRSECCTKIKLGNRTFEMPVVPANMECVINTELCKKLASNRYFYIMHRFNTNIIEFAKTMKEAGLFISISVGVNDDTRILLSDLEKEDIYPDFITIDIAHGHSIKMKETIQWIRKNAVKQPFIIAGNVSTADATKDLESWGADAIKVGIGPGSACTTYKVTGFGSRGCQASIVAACVEAVDKAVIIADGGIKEPGDIAKSLVLGAKMVMVGGMFSALTDSPGSTILSTDGKMYKEFWGSASIHAFGKKNRVEGIKTLVPMNNKSVLEMMIYLKESLQSAVSYGGGKDLSIFSLVRFNIKTVTAHC